MPVVNSQEVKYTLDEVLIRFGGAVTVIIKTEVADLPPSLKAHEISRAEALPFWGAHADPLKNRWEDLCGLLYQILIDRGDIAGVIQ